MTAAATKTKPEHRLQPVSGVIPTPDQEKKMSKSIQQGARCRQPDAIDRAIEDGARRRGVDVLRSVGAYASAMAYGALVVFAAVAATR